MTDNTWTQKKKDFFINSIIPAYKTIGHGEDCKVFLNGKLIYKIDKCKKIELCFADLENPLSGVFDLSKCGDAGKYLSINTGYRKRKITENSNKVEIWFTPWFSVDKNLNSTAPHLKPIFTNWNHMVAPIGIFWNWGDWDNLDWYHYLTSCDLKSISSDNLLQLYTIALHASAAVCGGIMTGSHGCCFQKFHVCFKIN